MPLAVIIDETHVFIFTKVVYVLEITPKLDVVILSLALVAATLGGGLGLLGRRHVFHWRLYLARFQVHVHRFGVRDRAHLCLVEPTQAANRECHTAFGFGFGFHQGVRKSVAFESGDAHGSDCLVCAPLRIASACRDDVDTVAVHLAPGDLHADAVDLTELIGSISLGVKSKSIVESDVLKWLGHRVETKALTYLGVVRDTLLRRKCGEIALDNDSFQHFCRLLGGHGQPRAVARHHSLTSTSTFTLNTSRSGSSTVT